METMNEPSRAHENQLSRRQDSMTPSISPASSCNGHQRQVQTLDSNPLTAAKRHELSDSSCDNSCGAISQDNSLECRAPQKTTARNVNETDLHLNDTERRYRPQKFCAVCGDKAIACNFNAVTCESCKAFFRRNAFKEQRLKCLFENRCVIDRVTRRFCSTCRLLKCFQIGMKREWILTDEQKQVKRVKILQNQKSKQQASSPKWTQASAPSSPRKSPEQSAGDPKGTTKIRQASNKRATKIQQRVETRDVGVSCPDERDFVDSEGKLLPHYCSLAYQCQFCSFKLNGAPIELATSSAHYSQRHNGDSAQQLAMSTVRIPYPPSNVTTNCNQMSLHANYQTTYTPDRQFTHKLTSLCQQPQRTPSPCCTQNSNPKTIGQNIALSSPFDHQQLSRHHQTSAVNYSQPGIAMTHPSVSQLHLLTPAQLTDASLAGQNLVPNQNAILTPNPQLSTSQLAPTAVQPHNYQLLPRVLPNPTFNVELEEPSKAHEYTINATSCLPEPAPITEVSDTPKVKLQPPVAREQVETMISEREPLSSANGDKSNCVIWNDELFSQPAFTDAEARSRIERLDFSDYERKQLHEMIEATEFMFLDLDQIDNNLHRSNSLDGMINMCDSALRRLIKSVKQIRAFRELSMDDQILLLKTACFKMLLLRSMFHYMHECKGWIDVSTGRITRIDLLKKAKKSLVYERYSVLVEKVPEPLRKDRLIMAIIAMTFLFDPTLELKHANSVALDNLFYLNILRKYLLSTQPDPLSKYGSLIDALQNINACNDEYNVFFSKDFQPEQITPLLLEIFDIPINNSM